VFRTQTILLNTKEYYFINNQGSIIASLPYGTKYATQNI
jgi:hypothetical protein